MGRCLTDVTDTLSVLALSSRFDGLIPRPLAHAVDLLSVLALSSRFDGPPFVVLMSPKKALSVLALSSRFDGRMAVEPASGGFLFQYSLCRVVLMVFRFSPLPAHQTFFQYSLCRVVLMVCSTSGRLCRRQLLSVLALSSRFDGPAAVADIVVDHALSVLALSSRFDGQNA